MEIGLVSVIVPVYNAEKTLQRCIESICAQTYDNYEVILVDDGSTDHSGSICDNYSKKNKKIHVLHIQNAGVSNARNKGIEFSKGEYLCFLDSDDSFEINALKELTDVAYKYGCDLVQGATRKIYDNGIKLLEVQETKLKVINRQEAMTNYIKSSKPIVKYAVWGKLFHKNLVSGCRFENKRNHEDVEFMAKIIDRCDLIVYTPSLVYKTYVLNESLSRRQYDERKIKDQLSTHDTIIELLKSNDTYRELINYALRAKTISIMDMVFDIGSQKKDNWQQLVAFLRVELKKMKREYQFHDLPHKLAYFLCCNSVGGYLKIRKVVNWLKNK